MWREIEPNDEAEQAVHRHVAAKCLAPGAVQLSSSHACICVERIDHERRRRNAHRCYCGAVWSDVLLDQSAIVTVYPDDDELTADELDELTDDELARYVQRWGSDA